MVCLDQRRGCGEVISQMFRNILTKEGRHAVKDQKNYDRAFNAFSKAFEPISAIVPHGIQQPTELLHDLWLRSPGKDNNFTEIMGSLEVQKMDDGAVIIIGTTITQDYSQFLNKASGTDQSKYSVSATAVKNFDHIILEPHSSEITLSSAEGKKASQVGQLDLKKILIDEPQLIESLSEKGRALLRVTRLLQLASEQKYRYTDK
jgi:hypothetical protein